jgi:hypothetical protein
VDVNPIIVQSTTLDTLCAGLSTETFRHLEDDMLLAYESDNWRRFVIVQRTIRRRLGIRDHSGIVFGARVQSVSFKVRAFVRLQYRFLPRLQFCILMSYHTNYSGSPYFATTLVLFRGHWLGRDGTRDGNGTVSVWVTLARKAAAISGGCH